MRPPAVLGLILLLAAPLGAQAAPSSSKKPAASRAAPGKKKGVKPTKRGKKKGAEAPPEQGALTLPAPPPVEEAQAPQPPPPAPVAAQEEVAPAPVADAAPPSAPALPPAPSEEGPALAEASESEAPAVADVASPSRFLLFPKVGAAFPQVLSPLGTTPAGALEVGYVLPVLGGRLALVAEAAYTQPAHTRTVEDPRLESGSATYTVTERTLGLYAGPKFFLFPLSSVLVPYASAGVRTQLLSTELVGNSGGADLGAHTETGSHVAFAGQLGAGLRLGPGHAVLEVQLVSSPIPHLITGQVDVGDLSTRAGYLFSF